MNNKLFSFPERVREIFEKFANEGYELYLVGGAVRDMLMGKIIYDWDFTTSATPSEILKIIPQGFYDNDFGTVGIKYEEFEKPFEITTFRTEGTYSDNRRPDKIVWGKKIKEDLLRRDFTINAIAVDKSGKIYDPYDGQKDLEKKIIKAVGNPNDRFREDALRMMRAIRIASELNFKIEKNTLEAITQNSSLIQKIAKERIKTELMKIISSDHPYEGMILFKESGLMEQIIPELYKCFGVEQKSPQRHHIYDVGTHLLMSLKTCNNQNPIVRLAVLLHDVGKPQTYKKLENGVITFYNHELVSTKIAKNIAERLRFSKKERDKFLTLIRYHQFTVDEKQSDSAIRRFIRNVGIENVSDMLDLRISDRLGSGSRETSWRLEEFKQRLLDVQKQPFSIKDLKINGNDVMKILDIGSGPRVGEILQKIFEMVIEQKIPNEKEYLLEQIKKIK